MYNIDEGVRQLQAIVVDRSIDVHLLPVHVCIESNLLVTCLQLYQSWNTVDNPERVGRKQLQLPSTVRSLPSYVKWMIHHAEQDIRSRNPPTPLSAMISKPLSRVQLYEESRHTRIQSLKISPVNLSISLVDESAMCFLSYCPPIASPCCSVFSLSVWRAKHLAISIDSFLPSIRTSKRWEIM